MPRRRKCTFCKGTGQFSERRKNGGRSNEWHTQTTICFTCAGTGYK